MQPEEQLPFHPSPFELHDGSGRRHSCWEMTCGQEATSLRICRFRRLGVDEKGAAAKVVVAGGG